MRMRVVIGAGTLLAVCVVIAGVAAGCGILGARRESALALPPTAAFVECERYAVVTAAHLSLYSDPLRTADIIRLLRRGELLSIVDKDIDQKQYYAQQAPWYLLRLNGTGTRGWGFGASFTTHCYRYQAELQQQVLKEKYGQ